MLTTYALKNGQSQAPTNNEYINHSGPPKVGEVQDVQWLKRITEFKDVPVSQMQRSSVHITGNALVNLDAGSSSNSDPMKPKNVLLLVPRGVPTVNLMAIERNVSATSQDGQVSILKRSSGCLIISNGQSTEKTGPDVTSRGLESAKKQERHDYRPDESSLPKRPRLSTKDTSVKDSGKLQRDRKEEEFGKIIAELIKKLEYTERLITFYQNSECDDRREISQLKAQCATYAAQIKEEQIEKNKLLVEVEKLTELNKRIQAEPISPKAGIKDSPETKQDSLASILKPYFTDGQIRCMVEGRKHITWSIDDFAAAISLRNVSPKAYRYLRDKLNFPLPSLLSLRQWALVRLDVSEGFLKDVLTVIREKGKTLSEMERVAVITFAEMGLTRDRCFDSKSQQIIGPCTKALVVMARGLFGNWKQPIYYKFDQPMTKKILNDAITLLDSANYQVVAVTCDIGNERIWSKLGITAKKNSIPHPVKTDQMIYAFADVPHLLKLIRNWCMDDGFSLKGCNEPLNRTVFQTIVVKSTNLSDSSISNRLTERIIDARVDLSHAVWPAARIWSRSTAKSVECIGKQNLLGSKDYQKYSDFILAVNNWFDVHNSKMQCGKHRGVNAYGVDEDNQQTKLALMTSYMESIRVGSRKKLMPFQEGVIISNASLRDLHRYLKERFPNDYKHLITKKLQQDVLENFFTDIRAMGPTKKLPTAFEFSCRFRWYILGVDSHSTFDNHSESEDEMSVYCISSGDSTESIVKRRPDILQPSRIQNSPFQSSNNVTSVVHRRPNTRDPKYEYEPDSGVEVLLTEELFLEIMNMSPLLATAEMENNSDVDNVEDNLHELDEIDEVQQLESVCEKSTLKNSSPTIVNKGLTQIAGYVAYRFRNKYPQLREKTHSVEDSTPNEALDSIQTSPKGHFLHPSRELFHAAQIVEKSFGNFHKAEFSIEDKVLDKVVLLAKSNKKYPDGIPDEVLQCLVRTRTYIRIKEMNKRMFDKEIGVLD